VPEQTTAALGSQRYRRAYEAAFERHLRQPSERTLRPAYELGREAVAQGLTMLEVGGVHHDALAEALAHSATIDEARRATQAAGDFLLEALSAFEMVRRGFQEARASAAVQRHHAHLLRRLSGFLADASLVLTESGSLEELLTLVTEQTLELLPADCAHVSLRRRSRAGVLEAAAYRDEGWRVPLERGDLAGIFPLVTWAGSPARLAGDDLAGHAAFRWAATAEDTLRPRAWMAVPLTTLDGRELGALQVLAGAADGFSDVDEAVLVHLAQMVSAAVDRMERYGAEGP
jgi:hypothetical protein